MTNWITIGTGVTVLPLWIGKISDVTLVRHGNRQLHTHSSTSVTDRHGNAASCSNPLCWNQPKIANSRNFQFSKKIWAKFQKNWKFETLSSKSSSVSSTEWEKYPIHWNWPKLANLWGFPEIPISNSQIPEIFRCRQKLPKISVNML